MLVQHEFGFFENGGASAFLQFLYVITKPIVLVFHTVLPNPDEILKAKVRRIAAVCAAVVVMTKNAAQILNTDYGVDTEKTSVIPHGTHLVPHLNKNTLKERYGLSGRKVLATFGLLSSGKSIETTLHALPEISLEHVKKMTTQVGMIQFSIINQPDLASGYTLDDNARAMIALCMHYALTQEESDLIDIKTYLDFIGFCQQPAGNFLNYVDENQQFTPQNDETNLADSNGRAIWALGFLISKRAVLPSNLVAQRIPRLARLL